MNSLCLSLGGVELAVVAGFAKPASAAQCW
jgi:hypothetical protein